LKKEVSKLKDLVDGKLVEIPLIDSRSIRTPPPR